jgi:hypothetical protein
MPTANTSFYSHFRQFTISEYEIRLWNMSQVWICGRILKSSNAATVTHICVFK